MLVSASSLAILAARFAAASLSFICNCVAASLSSSSLSREEGEEGPPSPTSSTRPPAAHPAAAILSPSSLSRAAAAAAAFVAATFSLSRACDKALSRAMASAALLSALEPSQLIHALPSPCHKLSFMPPSCFPLSKGLIADCWSKKSERTGTSKKIRLPLPFLREAATSARRASRECTGECTGERAGERTGECTGERTGECTASRGIAPIDCICSAYWDAMREARAACSRALSSIRRISRCACAIAPSKLSVRSTLVAISTLVARSTLTAPDSKLSNRTTLSDPPSPRYIHPGPG